MTPLMPSTRGQPPLFRKTVVDAWKLVNFFNPKIQSLSGSSVDQKARPVFEWPLIIKLDTKSILKTAAE